MATTSIGSSGVTFPDGTTQTTKAVSGGSGTVTSVATGNGLQGGTITTSGTLSVAAPSFNTVGSYCCAGSQFSTTFTSGSNYSAGGSINQVQSSNLTLVSCAVSIGYTSNLSGTWKWMAGPVAGNPVGGVACRVA